MRKMSGGLSRLDPSPHSLFPRSCFRFADYLGGWNRLLVTNPNITRVWEYRRPKAQIVPHNSIPKLKINMKEMCI